MSTRGGVILGVGLTGQGLGYFLFFLFFFLCNAAVFILFGGSVRSSAPIAFDEVLADDPESECESELEGELSVDASSSSCWLRYVLVFARLFWRLLRVDLCRSNVWGLPSLEDFLLWDRCLFLDDLG